MTKLTIEIPDEVFADISEIIKNKGCRVLTKNSQLIQNESEGSIWNSLNEDQKQEVLCAYEESENEENLVDAKVVFRNLK